MAAYSNDLVFGVETVEITDILTDGTPNEAGWVRIEDIEEGSVSLASTADTTTPITPEDKDTPIIILYVPGNPDVYNFALLQLSPDNLQRFFNITYDASTSTVTVLAKKKHASVALRLTTRPQSGVKKIWTFKNTSCDATYKNNITKEGLLAIAIAASILSWKTTDGQDAAYTLQTVAEDGSTINSSPSYDTTLDFTSAVTDTDGGVTGTVAATNAVTKFKFNTIVSPIGTPQSMNVNKSGSLALVIDYPSDYQGKGFTFIDVGGVTHSGVFTNGTVSF